MQKKIKLPAIISDVDGVIVLDAHPTENAQESIKFLLQPLSKLDKTLFEDINEHIPFICMTNAGGLLEQKKADSLNNLLELHDEKEKLTAEHIILNYTPLRSISSQFKDKIILLAGIGDIRVVAESLGIDKYLTVEEYCTLFPYLVPNSKRSKENQILLRPIIKERLGINDESIFDDPIQIFAIIILNDVHKWDECTQIMCDLCSSENGIIADKINSLADDFEHIPIYACSNDLMYAGKFRLPRIACGGAVETFKNLYKIIHKQEPKITFYGKPELTSYKYAEDYIRAKWKNFEITNFYMIGDNPLTDIKGANNAKWKSILVKTGMHQSDENDLDNPATFVVNHIKEAVNLILKLEGFSYNL